MKVGLTYDLRDDYLALGFSEEETAEFDRAGTIDAIEGTLRGLGFETERVGHVKSLVQRLASGARWDVVFNIAEGLYGLGREAQVPALLDAYGIPYTFSDSLVLSLTLHKGMTKRVVRDAGIATPDFAVVERLGEVNGLKHSFPLFAKPVAEGTGKGVCEASVIHNQAELLARCRVLLEEFKQPVLVEAYLSGREFTVGVVGTGSEAYVPAVMEVILLGSAQAGAYSYVNKEQCEERVQYRLLNGDALDTECKKLAVQAWQVLGCRDAGRVDIRCDASGKPYFLEVNPLAGLHPEHSDLPILWTMSGRRYSDLIAAIMDSALKRAALKR